MGALNTQQISALIQGTGLALPSSSHLPLLILLLFLFLFFFERGKCKGSQVRWEHSPCVDGRRGTKNRWRQKLQGAAFLTTAQPAASAPSALLPAHAGLLGCEHSTHTVLHGGFTSGSQNSSRTGASFSCRGFRFRRSLCSTGRFNFPLSKQKLGLQRIKPS